MIATIQSKWMETWTWFIALLHTWNTLDWTIVAVCIMCIIIGAIRGLRAQALSLFGYVVAFIIAAKSYTYFVPWVRKRLFKSERSIDSTDMTSLTPTDLNQTWDQLIHAVISFCMLFLFVMAGLWLLKYALKRWSSVKPIRTFDRIMGAFLGIVQFVCFWCIAYILLRAWPSGALQEWVRHSVWMDKTGEWVPSLIAQAMQWAQWI
ncbi:CvpA family protein [Paenibacillus taiwanensis]|uniref:CvpA family protein n=1 Tax=Paenibacillus taiwanensis TaxID=401638 RepID=UPI000417FE28|nr:CvpA family protein [Paenibacillus taiwanensis]